MHQSKEEEDQGYDTMDLQDGFGSWWQLCPKWLFEENPQLRDDYLRLKQTLAWVFSRRDYTVSG